jgi:hypothetical protein
MPKRATLRLAGPRSAGQKLYLNGWAPEKLFTEGPLKVFVSVNGRPLGVATLVGGGQIFELAFDLPAELVGVESIEVAVESARTFRAPPDVRDLSLRFGAFAVR